jgi:hypothetical protein
LSEGAVKTPDVRFDNVTWDIKYINQANETTIRNYIKDSRKADNVIFYFTNDRHQDLANAVKREVGRCAKLNKVAELPNIYCIDSNQSLILLWKNNKGTA